jgi:hypothetical protein
MTETYEVYGSKGLTLPELRDAIEQALGIRFRLHESLYKGGDYFRVGEWGGEEIVVQLNRFEFEGEDEIAEAGFPEYPVILSIEWTRRGHELQQRLATIAGLDFLRREVRPEPPPRRRD